MSCRIKEKRSPRLDHVTVIVNGQKCKKLPLNDGLYALVGVKDYAKLINKTWRADRDGNGDWRVVRGSWVNKRRSTVPLSKEIMNPPKGFVVDHKNHDTLDHRRRNLRIVTFSQNGYNTRGKNKKGLHRGVYWHRRDKLWGARIGVEGKQVNLGYRKSYDAACKLYDNAAIKYHGKYRYKANEDVRRIFDAE
jgi:hypothetical protein